MTDSKELYKRLLRDFTVEESREEKEEILFLVMEHDLGLSRAEVMAGKEVFADAQALQKTIIRLNNHEPVQYILGEAEFYGRKFTVDPNVLIPRPETELLIQITLAHFRKSENPVKILDIGTGCGCIAITLALDLPIATVYAFDNSEKTLAVAKKNSEQLNANVHFNLQDIIKDNLSFRQLDCVVSNPPYVLESEKVRMNKNVTEYEPAQALFVPDSNPLVYHKAIAEKAKHSLKRGGLLLTEINERLGKDTAALFELYGYSDVQILKDLNGKDRVVIGRNNN